MKNTQELEQGLASLKINCDQAQREKLLQYMALLAKWNTTYNLIANDDFKIILTEHVLDSLSVTAYIHGQTIIDIGTGAGLPGIPLAIVLPEKSFTLLDSIGKKIRFLTQAKIELGLNNIEIVQSRAEEYSPKKCFDTIISRAVTNAEAMITMSEHLLCANGKILIMKGRIPTEELQEIAWSYQVTPLTVPYLNKERHLLSLEGKTA